MEDKKIWTLVKFEKGGTVATVPTSWLIETEDVLEGFNGTVFAYGQTGSGKTFSINGCSKDYNKRGIIPRSVQYIFDHYNNIEEKPTVYISYMEIYNEVAYDLLSTKQRNVAKTLEELPRVFLLEDAKGDAHLKNLSIFPVTTEEEAMRLVFMGDTNRTIAETSLNEYSSRSHCIFTIHITHRSSSSKNLRSSKLHLVDLAGSERVYKSNTTGTVLHEAKFINLSLHFLQQVILALSESKRNHIPYRNSVLTHLLKDSLNGNCITTMLATLSICRDNIQETLSTCRFAQRVALISVEPTINEITDPQQEIQLLRSRIEELQAELSRSAVFTSTQRLTPEQKERCQVEVNNFINCEKQPIVVQSDIAQIQFCFNLLKNELIKKKSELKTVEGLISTKNLEIVTLHNDVMKKDEEIERLKTIIDKIPEKPVPLNAPNKQSSIKKINSFVPSYETSNGADSLLVNQKDQEVFEKFMSRLEIVENLNFYKTALQNKLNLAKIYAESIEQCKRKIIAIRKKLNNQQITCLEKQNLIKALEEQQKTYKKVLLEMKHIQNETNHLEAGLKQAEVRAYYKFKIWLDNQEDESSSLDKFPLRDVDKITNHHTSSSFLSDLQNTKTFDKLSYNRKVTPFEQPQKFKAISPIDDICEDSPAFELNLATNYLSHNPSSYTDRQNNVLDLEIPYKEYLDLTPKHLNTPDSIHCLHCCRNFESNSSFENQSSACHNVLPTIVDYVPLIDKDVTSKNYDKNNVINVPSPILNKRYTKDTLNVNEACTQDLDFTKQSNKSEKLEDPLDIETDSLTKQSNKVQKQDTLDIESDSLTKQSNIYEKPDDALEIESDFKEYFQDSDTTAFKDFMKSVTLSGVAEIDEEIVSFYRSKLC